MHELHRGFRVGGTFLPWGVLLAEASNALGGELVEARHYAYVRCGEACGFGTLSAQLTAPGPARPVTDVTFELSPPGPAPFDPQFWASRLASEWGPPTFVSHRAVPAYGEPHNAVTFHSRWEDIGTFRVGLSVYGALRPVSAGLSAGSLSVSWSEALAAQPFLPAWHARVEELARIASRLSRIHTYAFSHPLSGLYWGRREGDDSPEANARQRAVHRSLHDPSILTTPDAIAARLEGQKFALWTSEQDHIWCVSTPWDSVMFKIGSPVDVGWTEMLPARSGGYAMLAIGRWYVQGGDRSPEIAAAADKIGRLAGVTLSYREGHNC